MASSKNLLPLQNLFGSHLSVYTDGLREKRPSELYEPEAYILQLGGKRLRPLLVLMSCELFGEDPSKALDAALAVELFHNFSLVHDDILDAAPLRRNQPTVHHKWNTNIAILSGDVMLVKAWQRLHSYPAEQFKTLSRLFSSTSIEVCEGQQEDMNFECAQNVTVEQYIGMITRKTAVLLGCALQMGAVVAGADESNQLKIYDFGKHLGIAFQLLDDLLDAYPPSDGSFGKQVGGDIIANKKTFLLLKALEIGNESQKSELRALCSESDPQKKVKAVLAHFDRLKVKELCREEADRHTGSAIALLKSLEADEEKKAALAQFAKDLLNRQL